MSAPNNNYNNQQAEGMPGVGASQGHVGSVRSYGMGDGRGRAGCAPSAYEQALPGYVAAQGSTQVQGNVQTQGNAPAQGGAQNYAQQAQGNFQGYTQNQAQGYANGYVQGYASQPYAQAYSQTPGVLPASPAPSAVAASSVPPTYQPPLTSQPVSVQKKSRKGVIIGLIVAVIAIVLAILLALSMCGDEKSRRQGDAGQLEGKTDAEIQAELDRVVDEGMFNISIASVVDFENGSSPGDLRIENVPGNRYLMRVTIVRNDTGEAIYTTDMIEPNHHIQRDTLDVALPQGSYECTALFEALDFETEEEVGQAAAVITINVRS